jgi:hypothetical protein
VGLGGGGGTGVSWGGGLSIHAPSAVLVRLKLVFSRLMLHRHCHCLGAITRLTGITALEHYSQASSGSPIMQAYLTPQLCSLRQGCQPCLQYPRFC